MASHIIISWPEGDKRYEIPEAYTYRELSRIKTLTGIRAGEIEEALSAGDTDLVVALAQIAAERSGDTAPFSALVSLDFGAISLEDSEDADPTPAADQAAAAKDAEPLTTPETGGTPA